jgi:DsbC/DsbD-like thiol-disulfide interchange protein
VGPIKRPIVVAGAALALVVAIAAAAPATARAQVPEVELDAVPEYTAVHAGSTFRVAVRLRVPEGWHIGWVNPGGGGLPTTMAWQVPVGVTVDRVEWPYPETDESGGQVSIVYRGTVVLFATFEPSPGLAGSVRLSAELSWGLCSTECTRQQRRVAVSLPVAPGAGALTRTRRWPDVELALRALPVRVKPGAVRAVPSADGVRLVMAGLPAGPGPGSWLTFFPLEPGRPSVVTQAQGVAEGVAVMLPRVVLSGGPAEQLSGVLVAEHAAGSAPRTRPLLVNVPIRR